MIVDEPAAGEFFGFASMLDQTPHQTGAIALEETVCLEVDRKDIALLRTLYAKGGTDDHGDHFSGSAEDYIEFLAHGLPHMHVSNHCVCNHLIAIEGEEGPYPVKYARARAVASRS